MDLIGISMGIVTIPMAILTLAGIVGGVGLIVDGAWYPLFAGLAAIALGLGIAFAIEGLVALIDALAIAVAERIGRAAGLVVGFVGAALPMAVIIAWQWQSLVLLPAMPGERLAIGLWTYAVATLPWTILALRADGNRRTLSGIRAYAAHIAFWLLAVTRAWFGIPAEIALLVTALPALLPIAVGTLLAVADRDALRNVRI